MQACTSKDKLVAVLSSDQKIDPYGVVVSEKKHTVSISYYPQISFLKSNILFNLIIENKGDKPVKISNDNISVKFLMNGNKWDSKETHIQSLPEFTQDLKYDLQSEEKEKINDALRELDMLQVMESPSAEARFNDKVTDIRLKRQEYEKLEDLVPDLLLTKQTIMPGIILNAVVSCDTHGIEPDMKGDFEVTVSIDGEQHKFVFFQKYDKKIPPAPSRKEVNRGRKEMIFH